MREENSEDGTVKLKVAVDKVDADMDAIIYVSFISQFTMLSCCPDSPSLR